MEQAKVRIGVPRETFPGETRVATVPPVVSEMSKNGFEVIVEAGAGAAAGFLDKAYEDAGAHIGSRDDAFAADVVLQVRLASASHEHVPGDKHEHRSEDFARAREGQVLIGLGSPLDAPAALTELAARGPHIFTLELLPRIARAQTMDVLSSQATITGYRAALMAAHRLPKLFPMLTTAAGTLPAARVLVIGAGVAGLQAMATAHRIGALVTAYDVRPAARDDVESVGARFVELPLAPGDAEDAGGYAKALETSFYLRQQEYLADVLAGSDAAICTAAIPGHRAPVLLTADAVRGMAPGSVIVDTAAERGGNCELTQADTEVVEAGVTILGPTNLPASVPGQASSMFARNAWAFLRALAPTGEVNIDMENEIIRETLAATGGKIVHHRVLEIHEGAAA
ncbi:MAG: NAD(P) transhydrogenase subunit alpha [Actinomycetota bacterium]